MISKKVLKEWGLEESVTEIEKNRYRYTYDLDSIDFVFLDNEDHFFRIHNEIWCENKTEFFLVIFENGKICICDSRTKPNREYPLETVIDSFNHGENTTKARKYGHLFKRENIEAGECIKEIQKLLSKKKMRIRVDEDLMENMELCRKKITDLLKDTKGKEEIAEKIIDRCLFIRFLEDKSEKNELNCVLSRGNGDELLDLFDFYSEIFTNIFEKGDIPRIISSDVVRELAYIFGDSCSDSRFRGYRFGHIPVEVITRVYGRILSREKAQEKENSFIPKNVTDFIADNILEENIADKIRKAEIKILEPFCGSGGFLLTFLEKIIEKKGLKELREKIHILEKCFYGMDTSLRALRATAATLYLKAIEDERPDTIRSVFFGEGKWFTCKLNLDQGDLLSSPFHQKFDVIVCNLIPEESIETLLHIEKWMKKGALCSVSAPLLYFTTRRFEKLRKDFVEKYSLESFVNLSRLDKLGNPLCILFFSNTRCKTHGTVQFYTPEYTYFSKVTGFIDKDNEAKVAAVALKEKDNHWYAYALGCHRYRRLILFLDSTTSRCLEDFLNIDGSSKMCRDSTKPQKEIRICREGVSKTYNASSVTETYVNADTSSEGREEQEHAYTYVELAEGTSKERKLIVTRTWPIKAFISSDGDDNSLVYTLRAGCPEEYLLLFESLLNSKLAAFYLEMNHRLGEEGCPEIDPHHINTFPIPDLEDDYGIGGKIIETATLLKSLPQNSPTYKKVLNDVEDLIFTLYNLNYYDVKEIEQSTIERKGDIPVTEEDIKKYCEEFIDTMHSLVKKRYFLRPEWATSEFFGTMVRFSLSRSIIPLQYNKDMERFVHIIEKQETDYERKDIFKEKKIRFYDHNGLHIYKSNKRRDWTEFMAIVDSNEELHMYFENMEDE